ncbi:MAG TPA: YHS domain-containing protein [Acidobacteriota bacterium]|jgi:Cu+-exporting ATPase
MANHTDPVCGMKVNENSAADKSDYMGETYYFCSRQCKQKFDQNPLKYLKEQRQQAKSRD